MSMKRNSITLAKKSFKRAQEESCLKNIYFIFKVDWQLPGQEKIFKKIMKTKEKFKKNMHSLPSQNNV